MGAPIDPWTIERSRRPGKHLLRLRVTLDAYAVISSLSGKVVGIGSDVRAAWLDAEARPGSTSWRTLARSGYFTVPVRCTIAADDKTLDERRHRAAKK